MDHLRLLKERPHHDLTVLNKVEEQALEIKLLAADIRSIISESDDDK